MGDLPKPGSFSGTASPPRAWTTAAPALGVACASAAVLAAVRPPFVLAPHDSILAPRTLSILRLVVGSVLAGVAFLALERHFRRAPPS
jgi:hypothetical protein